MRIGSLLSVLLLPGLMAAAPSPAPVLPSTGSDRDYSMDEAHWKTAPSIGWAGRVAGAAIFARDEGIPTGTMKLNDGVAILSAATFAQGQIDLDIKPIGYSDAGIVFHARGHDDGEFVYVRANPDCPAAKDCVQYAPVTHGLMGWNIYPNYQASAPINATGWNHLTIRVAGDEMQLYVNHAAEPTLTVPRLLGLTNSGTIALKGPAVYANLVIRSEIPAMMQRPALVTTPGIITNWLAAMPTSLPRGHTIGATDIPKGDAWHPIDAEPTGLVNIGRAFGVPNPPNVSTGWLKTTIDSPTAHRVLLHTGFAMQLAAFANGERVFRGNNAYYPGEARLAPGGRIGFDNAAIPIDLKQGRNEIVFAVSNDWRADLPEPHPSHYGWAAEARVENANTGTPQL